MHDDMKMSESFFFTKKKKEVAAMAEEFFFSNKPRIRQDLTEANTEQTRLMFIYSCSRTIPLPVTIFVEVRDRGNK